MNSNNPGLGPQWLFPSEQQLQQLEHMRQLQEAQQQAHQSFHSSFVYPAYSPSPFPLSSMPRPAANTSLVLAPTPRSRETPANDMSEELQKKISGSIADALETLKLRAEATCKEISANVSKLCIQAGEKIQQQNNHCVEVATKLECNIKEVGQNSLQHVTEALREVASKLESGIKVVCETSSEQCQNSLKAIASNLEMNIEDIGKDSMNQIHEALAKSVAKLNQEADDLIAKLKAAHKPEPQFGTSASGASNTSEAFGGLFKEYGRGAGASGFGYSSGFLSKPGKASVKSTIGLNSDIQGDAEESSTKGDVQAAPIIVNDSESDSDLDICKLNSNKGRQQESDSDSEYPKKKNKRLQLSDVKKMINEKIDRVDPGLNKQSKTTKKRHNVFNSDDEELGANHDQEEDSDDAMKFSKNQLKKMKKDDIVQMLLKSNESSNDSPVSLEKCPICLGPFLQKRILPCGHCFCDVCLMEWHKVKISCPLCRDEPDLICMS